MRGWSDGLNRTETAGTEKEGPKSLLFHWGGWGRTSNLPVNSRALCRLSYTPRRRVKGTERLQGRGLAGQGRATPLTLTIGEHELEAARATSIALPLISHSAAKE